MSNRTHIQTLIQSYTRQLQKLREQEAIQGIQTPPSILIQIEDFEAKLEELNRTLENIADDETADPRDMVRDQDLKQQLATMERAEPSSTQMGGVNLGNISGSTINIGNVDASVKAGGDVVGRDKITTTTSTGSDSSQAQLDEALTQWREALQTIIDKLDDEDDREYAEKTANKAMAEAQKGEAADPKKVEGFLDKLSNMAPDILEVTATTLQNPFKGVGLVLEKINDRIKLERENR